MNELNQGLYKEEFEHDACGIGGIASINGEKTHKLIEDALDILIHLEHRGGTGIESNSGDGAGILFQLPHEFFSSLDLGFDLKNKIYGVGQIFVSKNDEKYNKSLDLIKETISKRNLNILGFREVPYNELSLGNEARKCMPKIIQVFIEKPSNLVLDEFERQLYIVRRLIEKKALDLNYNELYICSLSSKTIVYKGMLVSTQVKSFFTDLNDLKLKSAIATVHSRFSTNTFPSWSKAHPYRMICHNGEINTIKGNVNGIKAREGLMKSPIFKDELELIFPIIANPSSDSAMLDNVIEFLVMNGRTIEEAITLLIPEAWTKNIHDKKIRSYYEYNSTCTEPWDGPAAVIFTDGEKLGVTLDRNGLRPARYVITDDDYFIVYSEAGSIRLDDSKIKQKSRVEAGKVIVVDTVNHKVLNDSEIKNEVSSKLPYEDYVKNIIKLDYKNQVNESQITESQYNFLLKEFRYTSDDINNAILYMANNTNDKTLAMGQETPLPILKKTIPLLFDFFQQNFAQVTNPPIDSIREYNITSERIYVGREGNIIDPDETNSKRIKLESPIISLSILNQIKNQNRFKTVELDITYNETDSLKNALQELSKNALDAVNNDAAIIILTDDKMASNRLAIPSLLALSSIHTFLTKHSKRTHTSIILNLCEPREIHHFASLVGYGATAICPKLGFEVIKHFAKIKNEDPDKLISNYIKASTKGIVKTMSKMGISTIQSYNGAQIFESLGLSQSFVDNYFPGTVSSIGGIGIDELGKSILDYHLNLKDNLQLPEEDKIFDKKTIELLQESTKNNDYSQFKEYTKHVNSKLINLSDLLDFKENNSISIEEVEPVESILKRFRTGAMSFGAISKEAHETLAKAMHIINSMSNSGEGGEDFKRYNTNLNSDVKQVASSRFGVDILYLNSASEIQIKVAQGAKPGEGGNLPSGKVYPDIAKSRHSTPGVSLVSPPPHHDIYSIEDLAQLIYDLKSANPDAKISVKLVSEAGVGTVSSGVVKAGANSILISGFNGGTGAASRTSISHAGLPFEIGLSEAHQTLILNNLRKIIKLEVDGKLLTGKNVVVAALLGADLFSFATAPLIVIGCRMLKVCNLNTCPFGVATQDEKLRAKFSGKEEYVVNFLKFLAQEVREIMAQLGFKKFDDLIGHIDYLKPKSFRNVDFSKLLYKPESINKTVVHFENYKPHDFRESIDYKTILPLALGSVKYNKKSNISIEITNTNRALGTYLSHYLTKNNIKFEDDTITVNAYGNAGNSFGAFLAKGITLNIIGDCNDYLGKGLSGGIISLKNNPVFKGKCDSNIIAGNVILYGATAGKCYIDGVAGERFGVRLSGAEAVVLSIGNHGAEYMTGGSLVVLNSIGKNFMSGASGGISYIRNTKENLLNINMDTVEVMETSKEDCLIIIENIKNYIKYTDSDYAKEILKNINEDSFIKVIPKEYKHMMELVSKYKNESDGYTKAFYELIKK